MSGQELRAFRESFENAQAFVQNLEKQIIEAEEKLSDAERELGVVTTVQKAKTRTAEAKFTSEDKNAQIARLQAQLSEKQKVLDEGGPEDLRNRVAREGTEAAQAEGAVRAYRGSTNLSPRSFTRRKEEEALVEEANRQRSEAIQAAHALAAAMKDVGDTITSLRNEIDILKGQSRNARL
jgi:capsule polysaccharide export protein KpsE/RkpR